jgi:hypothetical protein
MELAGYGDLSEVIQKRATEKKPFTEDEVMFWCEVSIHKNDPCDKEALHSWQRHAIWSQTLRARRSCVGAGALLLRDFSCILLLMITFNQISLIESS